MSHKKKEITAEDFKQATSYDPVDDDLERANCSLGGFEHMSCGWNWELNIPISMLMPEFLLKKKEKK